VRYRLRSLLLQGAYTWSHSIDNQSDPLTGEFLGLGFTSIGGGGETIKSSFEQQYNSNGDRGNSDFDQRHNLVLIGTWQPESRRMLARDWRFSWLAAFRTGTPYTVLSPAPYIPDSGGVFENLRANLAGNATLAGSMAVAGGVQLLNPAAFSIPSNPDLPGNTGRNEFRGPGLYSIDASVARAFTIPKLREGTKFTVRADFFNILNHANLGNPDNFILDANFGVATYGRQGVTTGFPASTPLNETARQVQILLRMEF
jgi:hypothetical protein